MPFASRSSCTHFDHQSAEPSKKRSKKPENLPPGRHNLCSKIRICAMASFHFELVAPETLIYSGEAESVVVPGTEGEFTVFKDHAPVISGLRPGVVVIERTGSAKQKLYVRGGFAEVTPSGLTILPDQALPLEEVDAAKLDAEIERFEEELARASGDQARRGATEKRDQLRELKSALKI
jgi:F-type H+-transporting ATPase subunit epsilon